MHWILIVSLLPQGEVQIRGGQELEGRIEYRPGELQISGRRVPYRELLKIDERPSFDPARVREEYHRKGERVTTVNGMLVLAEWCATRGMLEEASRLRQRILEREPEHRQSRIGLAQVKIGGQWRDVDEAIAERLKPADLPSTLDIAEWCQREGFPDRAARLAARVLVGQPQDSRALKLYQGARVQGGRPSSFYRLPVEGRWWTFVDT